MLNVPAGVWEACFRGVWEGMLSWCLGGAQPAVWEAQPAVWEAPSSVRRLLAASLVFPPVFRTPALVLTLHTCLVRVLYTRPGTPWYYTRPGTLRYYTLPGTPSCTPSAAAHFMLPLAAVQREQKEPGLRLRRELGKEVDSAQSSLLSCVETAKNLRRVTQLSDREKKPKDRIEHRRKP